MTVSREERFDHFRKVLEFLLDPSRPKHVMSLPSGAKPLSAFLRNGWVVLCLECDTRIQYVERTFYLMEAGQSLPTLAWNHIATVPGATSIGTALHIYESI